METIIIIGLIISAYLIGSLASAIWIGKIFHGIDVRDHGSGNAGFTNAVRVLGWKSGVPVFVLDVLKGYFAVSLIDLFHLYAEGTSPYVNLQLVLGAAALLGHIFPIYANFKGGKGVATLLGLLLGIVPEPTLICLGIFIVVFTTTRYVSVSSMLAGIAFPILVNFLFDYSILSLTIFSILVSVLLLLTHQKNIERLLRHEESRVSFRRKHKFEEE